ncbi:MAG: hypothetical protein IIX59_00120, partial [Alistipes sp.]|nr:hypothetical protein [Alistipes sp.]
YTIKPLIAIVQNQSSTLISQSAAPKPNLKTYLEKRFTSHSDDKSTTNIPNLQIISEKLLKNLGNW